MIEALADIIVESLLDLLWLRSIQDPQPWLWWVRGLLVVGAIAALLWVFLR